MADSLVIRPRFPGDSAADSTDFAESADPAGLAGPAELPPGVGPPPNCPAWLRCRTCDRFVREARPGCSLCREYSLMVRTLQVDLPAMALDELKRRHGSMAAWIRAQVRAEVGDRFWPDDRDAARRRRTRKLARQQAREEQLRADRAAMAALRKRLDADGDWHVLPRRPASQRIRPEDDILPPAEEMRRPAEADWEALESADGKPETSGKRKARKSVAVARKRSRKSRRRS